MLSFVYISLIISVLLKTVISADLCNTAVANDIKSQIDACNGQADANTCVTNVDTAFYGSHECFTTISLAPHPSGNNKPYEVNFNPSSDLIINGGKNHLFSVDSPVGSLIVNCNGGFKTIFKGFTPDNNGGVIYTNNSDITINGNCVFEGNSVDVVNGKGGAIYAINANIELRADTGQEMHFTSNYSF